jgi:hypothetical protein
MPKIVTLWMFTPTHAEILSVSVIVTTAALYIGARPIWRSILLTTIAFLGLTHIVLGAPTNLFLVGSHLLQFQPEFPSSVPFAEKPRN